MLQEDIDAKWNIWAGLNHSVGMRILKEDKDPLTVVYARDPSHTEIKVCTYILIKFRRTRL